MKLIFGLGNPGEEYHLTRHNAGFMFVDFLAEKIGEQWTENKYVHSLTVSSSQFLLAKPQTFMNNSGEAASLLLKQYSLPVEDLVVVHDDLDIKLGEYKIQLGVGPKVHNGVNSIEEKLRSKMFSRVRVGIDNRDLENRIPGDAYVLQKFTSVEQAKLSEIISEICQKILQKEILSK